MENPKRDDADDSDEIERGHPGPPEMVEPLPLPGEMPTWAPVGYDGAASGLPEHPNLGDPTRRKHPTILSQEGQEEAPADDLPPGEPG